MTHAYWGLPDPDTKPEFYADVTAKRFVAWIIDTAFIFLLCLLILPFTAFTAIFFFAFLYLVVGFVYRTLTLANRSATPGMRLMAITIRNHDASPLNLPMAALHTLGYTVSTSLILLQVVSIILMISHPRGQSLTDLLLGTAAINQAARS